MAYMTEHRRRRLYVFEGPDNVGKSTVLNRVQLRLEERGLSVTSFAFPGQEDGTLGRLVYDLHHDPQSLGVSLEHPLARQILHVAAHVQTIDHQIKPALQQFDAVLLDRYWWSTWVYGLADGISETQLTNLLSVEQDVWSPVDPTIVFCLTYGPQLENLNSTQRSLARLYRVLAQRERSNHPVSTITNTPPLTTTVDQIVGRIVSNPGERFDD